MLFLKEDGTFGDTHESIPTTLEQDDIERVVEDFADSDIPRDIFKDSINIHSGHESGDCCEAGTYAEVEDQPNDSAFHEELIDFAEEEFGTISDESKKALCDQWDNRYNNYYCDSGSEDAQQNYFDAEPDYDDIGD